MKVDSITRRWISGPVDEYAAEAEGCRIDESRIDHFFRAISENVILWEGAAAGKPYEPLSWHYECLAPIFGWVRYSETAGRWVRRFKVASIWIGKKNGKSPTGAIVGLYLLRFDGEQGQQVYTAARDGRQAMITHQNAINMVRSSPALLERLRIQKTTGRISFPDTMSFFEPMSSDNVRSQEGKNGSIVIDECHVVGRRFGRTIADMGASREEPLRFEISTYGDTADAYGHDQWEYGLQVEKGAIRDTEFFFKAYAPSPKVTDAELTATYRRRPTRAAIKIWKEANPALGEILSIEDFHRALKRAKAKGATEWSAFKARRLMIWQTGAEAWLNDVWPRYEDQQADRDGFLDSGATVGLDLARVRDMSSAVFCCPPLESDEGYRRVTLDAYFWLPEARFNLLRPDLPQFDRWRDEGFLRVTQGSVTDFQVIREELGELIDAYASQVIVFDPMFAEDLTFNLAEDTGITRLQFKQTLEQYTVPTTEFERSMRAGLIDFVANPVLSWQASHVKLLERSAKKKPIKPEEGAHRTIDGIQASVMAYHGHLAMYDSGDTDDELDII